MLIGELAARTGVSARLLRYYESQGLLRVRRDTNGYRVYDEDAVTRVRQIKALLGAGLSTEQIRVVLPCASGENPRLDLCPELRELLEGQLRAVDDRIEQLRRNRVALEGLAGEVRV
ncbi:MerR family transcriptional regulator [Saccharomonospora xinjiangensis]|uniref:MerR family transcriptional regulator n=1 Tax=Saccharomonospora xinjiangensis TaxID=75294 RepID=UPI00350FF046